MIMDTNTVTSLKNKYKDEQVLIISFKDVANIPDKFSTSNDNSKVVVETLQQKSRYILRRDAEYRPIFQQIIPYTIIKKNNKYLIAKRIAGEERLLNMYSAGFGGHINLCDKSSIEAAAYRELHEELSYSTKSKLKFIGYVRDLVSQTPDHLGIVYLLSVDSAEIKEKDSLEGIWMTLKELTNNFHKFESWSKYIIDYLFILNERKLCSDKSN